MKQVEKLDTVTVTLIGSLDNGTVFETITESEPRIIDLGAEDTPKPMKQTLLGMHIGEMRKVRMEAEDGFGIRRHDLLQTIPSTNFSDTVTPKVGTLISMNVEQDGVTHQVPATIVEIKEDTLVIDYNHPLAGHPLNYEMTVVDIRSN